MATLNPQVFGAYDIRGHKDDGLDEVFARQLGNRVGASLGRGPVIVGRDGRLASRELANAACAGLCQAGIAVVDVGYTASPHVYWAMRKVGAVGAVMVTASHNDESYVGFKVVGRDGKVVPGSQLLTIMEMPELLVLKPGSVTAEDVTTEYAEDVMSQSGWPQGDVIACGIDAPVSVRQVLERIAPIAPSSERMAVFDSDADRVSFYEHGTRIRADVLGALLAVHMKVDSVVHDLRCSRAVLEYLHDQGITTYRSAVGRVAFGEMMRLTDAPLGFELSGHVYWKSFAGVEAPEYTLLAALRMIEQSRESLTELARPMMKYVSTEEINVPMEHAERASELLDRIARFGAGHNVDRLDGVTVDAWDTEGWWCNVRASHTEPLVRLVAEAKEKHLLDRVVTEVLALLRS